MADVVSAGIFATAGERRAAAELRKLPDHWLVVCNKMVVTNDGRTYEVDFIVVGDRWVFIIDEKSWWGAITGNEQRWNRADGHSERSPLNKTETIARPLAGNIRAACESLHDKAGWGIWVRGGVLLSIATQQPTILDPRAADGVFLFDEVCHRLVEVDSKGGNPNVGRARDEIKAYLLGLPARPNVPTTLGLYTVTEVVSSRPGSRIVHATLDGNPRTLMVYDLGRDPIDLEAQRAFYLREYKALQQLQATGLVPEVKDPFEWGDVSLIVPITPPVGRSLASHTLPETRDEFREELLLAAAAFDGLARIHKATIIHRALTPEALYIAQNAARRSIMFTDFFAARIGDRSTILMSLADLANDDPYAAPELVAGYGFATSASDVWSLGLIFIERIARLSIRDLRSGDGRSIVIPSLVTRWSSLPTDILDNAMQLFTAMLASDPTERPSAAVIARTLSELAQRIRVDTKVIENLLLDNRYIVERLLGQGAMARTFLVKDRVGGGFLAAKQFFRPSQVYEQVRAEFQALHVLKHQHLPTVYLPNPPENDVHTLMEYIPGPTLQELSAEFPWSLDRWWDFAQGLLSAVIELERHHIFHRDIKPANIILHEQDGRPVLIDFGLALPHGSAAVPAGTPLFLPPEAFSAELPPSTIDVYGTAIVLYQALTGESPFENADGPNRVVRTTAAVADEARGRLADVLLQAVANNPHERPASAAELQRLLQIARQFIDEPEAVRELPDLINPWVDAIRGLYRNSATGNADNRGLDSDFVRNTYVPTALDDRLLPLLLERRPKAVFLSGNPGDGKTAFLEQMRVTLEREGGNVVQDDKSGWEINLGDHAFRSCYDASEAHEGQSADEQLSDKLTALAGSVKPQTAFTALVAINDGRLADFFERHRDRFGWLGRQVDSARTSHATQGDVWIIDLKRRTFVSFANQADSIAQRVLDRLVAANEWAICDGCAAQTTCPIRTNARALRTPVVRTRLEYVLLLSHLRRQRHTTMRDLRSALAYLVTGNLQCTDVHAARQGEPGSVTLVDRSYWRSTFAPMDSNDELLDGLTILDPARFPHPRLDRFLHFHRTDEDAPVRAALFTDGHDLPPHWYGDTIDWMNAVKRRLFFEGASDEQDDTFAWRTLLPYRYAEEFLDLLGGRRYLNAARERIGQGILRSDNYSGIPQSGHLSIKVDASEAQRLVVMKQFPLEEFELRIEHARGGEIVEAIPNLLIFKHISGTPRLEITLDLYELLMRLAGGLQPSAPEFQPLLEDLAPFKSALLLRQTTDLVLVEGQRPEHRVTQRDGKIVRLHDKPEVRP